MLILSPADLCLRCMYKLGMCKERRRDEIKAERSMVIKMIRAAADKDMAAVLEIYRQAREFMAANGNPNQWGQLHPKISVLQKDLRSGQLYVCAEGERIYGVFAFVLGEDSTYGVIENGRWLSGEPYGTIHRIAGERTHRGVFRECMEYCRSICPHLRIDTHADNRIMQHCIEKNGFVRCGIIYVQDGSPRIAYEYLERAEGKIS